MRTTSSTSAPSSSSSSSSSFDKNNNHKAFRRSVLPHESLAGICIQYNISMQELKSVNNGFVNENTAHAKGWVMIPHFDRDGKRIISDASAGTSGGKGSSDAIDKLRRHYELPGTPEKDDALETNEVEEGEGKDVEVIDTIRYEYKPAEKKGVSETKTRKKEREENVDDNRNSNSNTSVSHQHGRVAKNDACGPSSMFARDKPLFTPHKEKPAAAADAITMEGTGIRAAMKYKTKTFFSKLKSKALHLTADLREEQRAGSPNFRESLNDIRGPPPKGKGD